MKVMSCSITSVRAQTIAPQPSRSVALQKRENLRGPFLWLLEGRPVAAIVEQNEARIRDVIKDRDRDLERHHAIVAAVDQQDGRFDAGERSEEHTSELQ